MSILSGSIQNQLRNLFAALPRPVTLLVFDRSNDEGCESCRDTRSLVEEVAAVSGGKVTVEAIHVDTQPDEARSFHIDKVPAIAVLGGGPNGRKDFGIRFFGAPAGYEFATLIEDIRMASTESTDLRPGTVDVLSHVTSPLHLQVFVTPTCPYCPRAVLLAHKMAMASDWITADAVDATEFPELADRYQVQGVPRTVVNDAIHVEGAVPEAVLLAELIPLLESTASLPA